MLTVEEILAIVGALCIRAMMSIHPHSGQGTPPMYGDYEAQRHWQEITVNLPMSEWYFDTKDNNLTYWGLDYPPLTAYHSLMLGKLAKAINPSYVTLNESRGYETPQHKNFMRSTVILSDILVFAPAVVAFGRAAHNKASCSMETIPKSLLTISLLLTYPGLILIDNGHFQYNNMSLGLMVASVACLFKFKDLFGSILFVAALNYKQMELYHALPFFSYLLGRCVLCKSWTRSIGKLIAIGLTVIASFVIIWLPFILYPTLQDPILQVKQMMLRLFPVGRGIFEDKVSNIWCAVNVFVKIRQIYPLDKLLIACAVTTGAFSLPSNILLFLKPTRQNFLLALINTSLVFFMFSFQVHEKTILLVAIPTIMYLGGISSPSFISYPHGKNFIEAQPMHSPTFFETRHSPLVCVWLVTIAVFSMFPLLQRDLLSLPTLSLLGCFLILCHYFKKLEPVTMLQGVAENYATRNRATPSLSPLNSSASMPINSTKGRKSPVPKLLSESELQSQNWGWIDWIWWTAFNLSIVGCLVIGLASVRVSPPPHLPHLWSLLISVYCASHFIFFAIYLHVLQFRYYFATGIPVAELGEKGVKKLAVYTRWTETDTELNLESKKTQ